MRTLRYTLLQEFSDAVYVLRAKKCDTSSPREVGLHVLVFSNVAGRMDGGDKRLISGFDDIVKICEGTGGIVTPQDMIDALKPIGPDQAAKLSDDGIFHLAGLVKEEKMQGAISNHRRHG